MSPPPRVILLDSNAYLRLARSIRPLLRGTFGAPPPYSLFILKELEGELASSARLRMRFEWFSETDLRQDRAAKVYRSAGKPAQAVEAMYTVLAQAAVDRGLNVSREDLHALAVGLARGFPVVTDDGGMIELANLFQIDCWRLLKLLRLMATENRITQDQVTEILEYLREVDDLPAGIERLRQTYRDYFGTDCPI